MSQEVYEHSKKFVSRHCGLDEYSETWRNWITSSTNKHITGLEEFQFVDFVNGTSQTFDHFWLRHRNHRPVALMGEFKYHDCVNRQYGFCYLKSSQDLQEGDCMVISLPFSDYGTAHPEFQQTLETCDGLGIPVCLDLAYWGIAHSVKIDLSRYTCIDQITCSLSKPFWTLENHRVGVRFSKHYNNDGISMINEIDMQNFYSMSLAQHFMLKFDCDWISRNFKLKQHSVCRDLGILPSDTVIFGLAKDRYHEYNRGIPGNNRVCISDFLNDLDKEHYR